MFAAKNQFLTPLIPSGGASVEFTAGSATGSGPTSTSSQTLTITANVGDRVLIGIATSGNSTGLAASNPVTYSDGGTLTLLKNQGIYNSTINGQLWVYELTGFSAGGGTLTVTMASSCSFSIDAVAYSGVGSITGVASSYGYTTSSSQSATGVANGLVVKFTATYPSGTITASAGTARQAQSNLAVAEIGGTGSQTITHAFGTDQYAGVIMVLNPT